MPPPLQVDNIFAFASWRCCSGKTIYSYSFARWHLFRRLVGYLRHNKLTFDLLTLKVVSESRVTWATSVPILVFLGLSVLELGRTCATDRQTDVKQTDVRQKHAEFLHAITTTVS